jgi:hypothetical protein
MTIVVTQHDIDNGIRPSTCFCPIALAVKRAINDTCTVGRSYILYKGIRALPLEAVEFIALFDSGQVVKPFSFWLSI